MHSLMISLVGVRVLLLLQGVLAFTTVAQGTIGQVLEPREVVVRSDEAWELLWSENSPQTNRPAVDFSQTLLVGMFLGSRPTAGFTVEIVQVRRQGTLAVVEYVEHRPAPGTLTAQVLTAPFHVVSLPRDVHTVRFTRLEPSG